MRATIDLLKAHNEIKIITQEVDVNLEIPTIAYLEVKKEDSKALLFTNPVDKALGIHYQYPVLMNLFGSFSRIKLFFGDIEAIATQIADFIKTKPPTNLQEGFKTLHNLMDLRFCSPKIQTTKGLCQEVIHYSDTLDLESLPILKTWSEDGGKFITMGQCYTQSLDGKIKNLGMYRLQVFDKKHLGLHWQIHKDSMRLLEEYQQANQKMPVSIGIGGNPLYTWCATAPLPKGIFELALYGFIKKQKPKLVPCVSNPLSVPYDCDFVLEGWVDPHKLKDEGRFGDHTGFYTPIEPYPILELSAITHKKNPVYLATIVGKPPLEDKYLGYPTERIFLPLLQTTTPDLIDYYMPENGVFHNLILAKIKANFPASAEQSMHAFWGVGQMSFVKHAIFVGEDAPNLNSKEIIPYILNRFCVQKCLITHGICDALDHASPQYAQGGKLGIDCVDYQNPYDKSLKNQTQLEILNQEQLMPKLKEIFNHLVIVRQFYTQTQNPITLLGVNKQDSLTQTLNQEALKKLEKHLRILVILDAHKNDLDNLYMILWRVVNNIDAKRDIVFVGKIIVIDATDKNAKDEYFREWPKETDCQREILDELEARNLLGNLNHQELEALYQKFHIDKSYATNLANLDKLK